MPDAAFTCLSVHDPDWLSFIRRSPQANLFHHPVWINLLAESYGYQPAVAVVLGHKGEIRAGLPTLRVKTPFGSVRRVALPFTDHCRPLAVSREDENLLLAGLLRESNEPLEVRWKVSPESGLSLSPRFVLSEVPLPADPEVAARRIEKKDFCNVRAARKAGVMVLMGTWEGLLRDFYGLHTQARQKFGLPVQPAAFFRRLREGVLEKGHGFILGAYQGADCLASAVFLHWNTALTYKFAAGTELGRKLHAMDLILWTAMEWGCAHGCDRLDMGRSEIKQHGLREYKARWGAIESDLPYAYYPAPPGERVPGVLQTFVSRIIRQSPVWVCRSLGNALYRYWG